MGGGNENSLAMDGFRRVLCVGYAEYCNLFGNSFL
jgi:hypothetical protein